MFDLIIRFWYFWLLLIILALLKLFRPVIKGWIGEKKIAVYLSMLPKTEYTVLNDVIMSTDTGTTQIDHIVISVYGIFVIETKNYSGRIYGGEMSAKWTQNIHGHKSSFMNPLHQNYAHVKAIEAAITSFKNIPIISIVAFSAKSTLKVKTTSHVTYFHRVNHIIRGYSDRVINDDELSSIVSLLQRVDINSAAVKKEHIASVIDKKNRIENAAAGDTCPKCSGTLIERQGKNGRFVGCSNYPKCRFTK